jgi:hypothetical protein
MSPPEQLVREVQIVLSAGGQFYAVLDIPRTCGLWLSIAKYPLPVPPEWHRPGNSFAAVMRGRDYYRVGVYGPQHQDGSRSVPIDDELVKDWRDTSWWTPGLQESWAEIDSLAAPTVILSEAKDLRGAIPDKEQQARKPVPQGKDAKKGANRG